MMAKMKVRSKLKKPKLSVTMNPDALSDLKMMAEMDQVTVSAMLERCVDQYLQGTYGPGMRNKIIKGRKKKRELSKKEKKEQRDRYDKVAAKQDDLDRPWCG